MQYLMKVFQTMLPHRVLDSPIITIDDLLECY